jgi:RNA polymerase sigma factor (sigma-70 family)
MTFTFADAVASARPRVTAVVARLVGDDAEDVVQEAVLRAFLSLSALRDAARFESWLCGIALNVAKMRLRRAASEARALSEAAQAVASADAESLEDLRAAVALLPPAQRDAVLLHYVDGMSCEEVAVALGSTPGAVRVRLHRARAELRRHLLADAPSTPPREEIPMIELTLEDVIVRVDADDPSKLVWDQRIVILREKDGNRALPIWIGAGEGNALALRLHDSSPPRPLTADLMTELVRALGARVDHVAITRLEENTFYASIAVAEQELDARPSDAINLAIRTGSPIVVAPGVLEAAGVVGDGLLAAELDSPEHIELPPGEWRSLSSELLEAVYR